MKVRIEIWPSPIPRKQVRPSGLISTRAHCPCARRGHHNRWDLPSDYLRLKARLFHGSSLLVITWRGVGGRRARGMQLPAVVYARSLSQRSSRVPPFSINTSPRMPAMGAKAPPAIPAHASHRCARHAADPDHSMEMRRARLELASRCIARSTCRFPELRTAAAETLQSLQLLRI